MPERTESESRRLLRRLRDSLAAPGGGQDRLDRITHHIADSMRSQVCSVYLFRDADTLELCATEGLRAEAVHRTRLRLGEGLVGRVARTGLIPRGYWKDAEKSAKTFVVVEGQRYTMPGDWGVLEEDGANGVLPAGVYRFANAPHDARLAALAFALGCYRFGRYRKNKAPEVRLVPPDGIDAAEIAAAGAAVLGGVGVQDLGPAARVRQADAVVRVFHAREVVQAGHRGAVGAESQEAEHVVLRVVGVHPLEPGRVAVPVVQRRLAPAPTGFGVTEAYADHRSRQQCRPGAAGPEEEAAA